MLETPANAATSNPPRLISASLGSGVAGGRQGEVGIKGTPTAATPRAAIAMAISQQAALRVPDPWKVSAVGIRRNVVGPRCG